MDRWTVTLILGQFVFLGFIIWVVARAREAHMRLRSEERRRPRDRALLWLAYVEGYDHREIAKVLGLQERSVRVILFRARKKLEKELA